MSKHVYRNAKIEIGGVDISDHVFEYSIRATIGEAYEVMFRMHDNPDLIRINGKPVIPVEGS